MAAELAAFEALLAEYYCDLDDIRRIADQCGIGTTKLSLDGESSLGAWHKVLAMALREGRLDDLWETVRKEYRNSDAMLAAWTAYRSSTITGQKSTPQGERQEATMSDAYRSDSRLDTRVDTLQRDIADLRTTVARLETALEIMSDQNKTMVQQNQAILQQLNTHWQYNAQNITIGTVVRYLLGLVVVALVVYGIVYYGGRA